MTSLLRVLLVSIAAVAVTQPAAAGIEGVWLVKEKTAHIEIATCDDGLCGTIVWLSEPRLPDGRVKRDVSNPDPDLRDRPILGLTILEGLTAEPNEKGSWTGGRIYDPESGNTYKCKVSLDEEGRLRMRGYLGFSLLGRTTTWTRVRGETELTAAP